MLSSYPRACIPFLTRHLPTPTCSAKHPWTYTVNVLWYRCRVYWEKLLTAQAGPQHRSWQSCTERSWTCNGLYIYRTRCGGRRQQGGSGVEYLYSTVTIENGLVQKGASFHACVLAGFRRVWLCATGWTIACQGAVSMGFSKARVLKWVAMPSSKRSSQARDRTHGVFCLTGELLTTEPPGKPGVRAPTAIPVTGISLGILLG